MKEALELLSIILSALSLLVSLAALGVCLGMRWSSHKIEFKPLELKDLEEEANKLEAEETASDEEMLGKAKELQKKAKRNQDPLDDILSTSNF